MPLKRPIPSKAPQRTSAWTEIYELAKKIETEARGNQLDRTLEWILTLRNLLDQVAEGLKQEGWKQ